MSIKSLYRIGGIAAILSALIEFKDAFLVDPNAAGTKFDYYTYLANNIFLVLIALAFYYLYSTLEKRLLSHIALILAVAGAVIPFTHIEIPDNAFTWIFALEHVVPIFVFGILVYLYRSSGMPRTLGAIGILYAVVQVTYYGFYNVFLNWDSGMIGNFPAILNLVWLIWTGVLLLSGKLYEAPHGINTQGLHKKVIATILAISIILFGADVFSKGSTISTPSLTTSTTGTPTGYGVEFPFELDPMKEWGQNINVTCENNIDQTFLDPDTVRKLVVAGGKLDITIGENTPSYLWTGNVPLDLFYEPEDDGTGYGIGYNYWGTMYCVTGLTGAKVDANGLGPDIYVITRVVPE